VGVYAVSTCFVTSRLVARANNPLEGEWMAPEAMVIADADTMSLIFSSKLPNENYDPMCSIVQQLQVCLLGLNAQ
jgi:hypothetical protein